MIALISVQTDKCKGSDCFASGGDRDPTGDVAKQDQLFFRPNDTTRILSTVRQVLQVSPHDFCDAYKEGKGRLENPKKIKESSLEPATSICG